MLKRSRTSLSSSSPSFFCWCATFSPSPALPRPKPLTVFARITVGAPLLRDRRGVGGVDLLRIVAAAVQAPDLVIGHVGDHLLQLRILAEEVLARVGAALGLEVLVLAVDALLHEPLAAAPSGRARAADPSASPTAP